MASPTLPVLSSPKFPQVFISAIDRMVVRAIVHLNFNEPDQARDVLLDALTEINFRQAKGDSHVNAAR